MLSNFDESEGELNLDLPPVLSGKKKISNRICESSEAEQSSNNTDSSNSSDANDSNSDVNSPDVSDTIVDSDLENSIVSASQITIKSSKKEKGSKKKQFLSRDYIDNSDFDDNPLTLEELAGMNQKSESEDEGDSFEVDEYGERIRKARKSKKKEEFVNASEDFKSRLKLMPYDDSETDNGSEIDDADSEDNSKPAKPVRLKKPKETLKKVLKESEALLRWSIPVDLEIKVPKPKTLDLILNEALAANSRTPAEAKKRVIDEKRRIQRMKLEKILGAERMASLIKDEPKIGHSKLEESIEIEVETVDEKAAEGEEIAKEIFKVKLTDLPDKHFDGKNKSFATDTTGAAAGYKAYIQSQKKASIELLNIQLQEKIRAQSNAALLYHQRAQAAHLAARRAKAEERERKQKEIEVRKERELKEKREKKVGGGELFKKEKYEGIERPAEMDTVRGYDEIFETRKPTARIILSEDEVDNDDRGIEDLLNLDHNEGDEEDDYSDKAESEGLPDIDEAMDERVKESSQGLDSLLSGKFAETGQSDHSEADSDATVLSPKKKIITTPRIKSMFIDDEASDENEEKENDEIDEEALQEEMRKSNFIAESGDETDVDPAELRAFANKKSIQEDEEINKKLIGLLGKHFDKEEGDEFFNSLGNKYGLNEESDYSLKKRSLTSQSSLDEDIRKLLDPIEQKKRKLAALGSLNILNRRKQIEAAGEEFQFAKRPGTVVASDCSSDYYATTDESDSDNSDGYEGGGYYEEVESGLQSRVEEMLDEEMLDGEEVQVQATESLSIHLQTITKENENIKDVNSQNSFNSQSNQVNSSQTNKITNNKARGVAVPTADAKLKSRLLALQQENDEIVGSNNSNSEKFKGFSIGKK